MSSVSLITSRPTLCIATKVCGGRRKIKFAYKIIVVRKIFHPISDEMAEFSDIPMGVEAGLPAV